MYYKVSKGLKNISDAKLIRKTVFVDEQQFKNEFDDKDNISVHVVAYKGDKPIATARYYPEDDGVYHIGRIAVIKEFRGQHIGEKIVSFCEQRIWDVGGKRILLSAQERVKGFYQRLGYREYGESYMDEHVSHIAMKKELGKTK